MKTLFTFFLLIFIFSVADAQETKYGVKAGMSISNMTNDPAPVNSNKHRNGFVFGGFVDYGFTENLSGMVELQYSGEGANEEGFRKDYLNLPVILKYNLVKNISVGIGPQVGLKIHKENDGFQNFTFAGVGYFEFAITDEFAIDFRYNYGLSNLIDNNLPFEATAGVMQFGINYKL
jgi:hypothetical protein